MHNGIRYMTLWCALLLRVGGNTQHVHAPIDRYLGSPHVHSLWSARDLHAYLKRCPAPLVLLARFMLSCVCLVSSRPRLSCPDPTCPCPVSSCLVGGSAGSCVHSLLIDPYLDDLAPPLLRLQMPI